MRATWIPPLSVWKRNSLCHSATLQTSVFWTITSFAAESPFKLQTHSPASDVYLPNIRRIKQEVNAGFHCNRCLSLHVSLQSPEVEVKSAVCTSKGCVGGGQPPAELQHSRERRRCWSSTSAGTSSVSDNHHISPGGPSACRWTVAGPRSISFHTFAGGGFVWNDAELWVSLTKDLHALVTLCFSSLTPISDLLCRSFYWCCWMKLRVSLTSYWTQTSRHKNTWKLFLTVKIHEAAAHCDLSWFCESVVTREAAAFPVSAQF